MMEALISRQEDLVPINIEPTERGTYGYLLDYLLDLQLVGQGLFCFQTLLMQMKWPNSEH